MMTKDFVSDNISITYISYAGTLSCEVKGYTPIGIVGYQIINGTTNGALYSYTKIGRAFVSNNTINYRIDENGASDKTPIVQVLFRVLYMYTG
jgi:hypothetical protein